jgi:hypothetical protein
VLDVRPGRRPVKAGAPTCPLSFTATAPLERRDYSYAVAVNPKADIVGFAFTREGFRHAVLWPVVFQTLSPVADAERSRSTLEPRCHGRWRAFAFSI